MQTYWDKFWDKYGKILKDEEPGPMMFKAFWHFCEGKDAECQSIMSAYAEGIDDE